MKCQRCTSPRIVQLNAKCSDMCWVSIGGKVHNGYVPKDIGLKDRYGDYVTFDFCIECGQIQGKFPVKKTALEEGCEE